MKKRLLSVFLVGCMLMGIGSVQTFAAAKDSGAMGELCLTICRSWAVAETDFEVQLETDGDVVKEGVLHAGLGERASVLTLADIADGIYNLTISAPYYLPYTQTLEFDGQCIHMDLYNYASVNEGRASSRLFGVLPVGDLNEDNQIDDKDADCMVEAIDAGYNAVYDLNGDGQLDLADLAIVVRNQNDPVLAPVVHTVSSKTLAKTITVAEEEGTVVKGDSRLSDLLDQQKTEAVVSLSSVSGKISQDTPAAITLTAASAEGDTPSSLLVEASALLIASPASSEGAITGGEVIVETMEGTIIQRMISHSSPQSVSEPYAFAFYRSHAASDVTAENGLRVASDVTVENDGTVVIDLGQRVAIKKVTIRVTATANQGNLAEIAKVEFLGDYAERIPEPQLSIPTVLSAENTESDGQGYKNLTVTWDAQPNVTGYEVSVSGPGYHKTASTPETSYTFQGDSFNGTVKSFEEYDIKVRSVSGDWRSDWSTPYTHAVTCTKTPPAPQYVTAVPAVEALRVSWNCKFDAEYYSLYYKPVGADTYDSVKNLAGSQYTLTNLQGGVQYTLYVIAHNRNGDSPKSNNAEGMPTTATGVVMPKYKLLNVDDGSAMATTHITGISGVKNKSYTICRADGTAVSHTEATEEDWKALLDNDPSSYLTIPDWDSGVVYTNFRGPILQLDKAYTMDTIRISPHEGNSVPLYGAAIGYKTEAGELQRMEAVLTAKYDGLNRLYYEITMEEPVTTDYLEIRTRAFNTGNYTICEVKLYEYDDLEDTVEALFLDSMRTVLKDGVTEEQIQDLIRRTNTADPVSGETHPHRDTILTDLNYAMQLLQEGAAAEIITVDNQITTKGSPANGFAQVLSDYQPLGYVAAAGDTVVLYVSDGKTAKGTPVNLYLVATQFHPEVTAWQGSAIQLKAGRNEITIPKIGSYAKESGGSLYLQYTGSKGAENYTVRVSGGTKIPVLHLDGVTGADREQAIMEYVAELEKYAAGLEALHETVHAASDTVSVNAYEYDPKECFLNMTDITMENMMFSVPATQVLSGLGSDSREERLRQAIAAMEQEIEYFYQFKGLHKDAADNDAYPYTRLNIRYHQMFTGAFMYAAGKHIGIEFGSVAGLFGTEPVATDKDGQKTEGRYSGWGIAHEIGHCINAAAYQRVEVTNNVFAQLAQTDETSASFRTSYEKVYKAVATGTTGHTGDLAVQLAMYWQLHLAYDNDYTYKMYDSIEAQQSNLFYARLESYLRDRSKAPHAISASGGDQLFMQTACAAANKNILSFFKAWGFSPDADTIAYAKNFKEETRKIQYIDDDSRLYRIQGQPGMSTGTTVSASITNAENSRINGNQVIIHLSNSNTNADAMLGYEICRNGKMTAFVPAGEDTYTDIVATENNKAFVYTVTGIDRLLRETETLALPEVKVCHDGSISKDGWYAETNMSSLQDSVVEKDENDPESGIVNGNTKPAVDTISAIGAVLDNDKTTVYYGRSSGGNNRPYILLNLGGVEQVTALKFTPAPQDYSGNASEGTSVNAGDLYKYRLFGYTIEISLDGEHWETVKSGDAYTGNASIPSEWKKGEDVVLNSDGSYTLYFNKQMEDGSIDPFMYTYDAAYVKLTATNMSALAVAELDILGPTGDNVELIPEGYGKLTETYPAGSYADGSECVIPAGSVVFYGAYKGDPSYNVVLLKDQDGNVLDGSQLIFAAAPAQGALGETSDGRWLFWLEDQEKTDDLGDTYNEFDQLNGLTHVMVELYRVQDAQTLAGQRLTSTSLHMTIPAVMPDLVIAAQGGQKAAYKPDASAVQAAKEYTVRAAKAYTAKMEEPVSAHQDSMRQNTINVRAIGYGDTGAAEREAPSLVQFSVCNGEVAYEAEPDTISVAAQIDFMVSPCLETVQLDMDSDGNLFQSSRYDSKTGKLTLYVVKRSGILDNMVLTGIITGGQEESGTVSAIQIGNLDRDGAIVTTDLMTSAELGGGLYEKGDVNGDNFVDTSDAVVILKYFDNSLGNSGLNLRLADVDSNGRVNEEDARMILEYNARLITAFGG